MTIGRSAASAGSPSTSCVAPVHGDAMLLDDDDEDDDDYDDNALSADDGNKDC